MFTWHSPDVHLTFTWLTEHHLTFPWPSKTRRGSIRSSLRDGLSTPYRLTKEQCLTPSKINDVLTEHGGLPYVLPPAIHLYLEHLPNTRGYLGLLSVLPPRPSKSYGGPWDFSVSPRPIRSLNLLGTKGLGPELDKSYLVVGGGGVIISGSSLRFDVWRERWPWAWQLGSFQTMRRGVRCRFNWLQ